MIIGDNMCKVIIKQNTSHNSALAAYNYDREINFSAHYKYAVVFQKSGQYKCRKLENAIQIYHRELKKLQNKTNRYHNYHIYIIDRDANVYKSNDRSSLDLERVNILDNIILIND